MKNTNLAVAIALLAISSLALAEEEDKSFYGWTQSASVALTTDYVWRGISQTNNDPAIQGSFDLSHESGFYLGAWASNVEFADGSQTSLELDAYAGFSRETDFGGILPIPVTYDIGWLHYEFPASPAGNINEIYFGAGISPIENFNFAAYYYLDVHVENTIANGYIDLSADYTLPDWAGGITLIARGGHYDRRGGADDYWDWKLGIARDIGGFNFELAYHDTDGAGAGNLSDGRVVATVSRELGGSSAASADMLPEGFESSASVALTTDYIWRGVSQTNNDPSIQGSFDISHESGAYIGVWASNVEFQGGPADRVSIEIDGYVGFSRDTDFGGALPFALTYDVGFLHYEFPSGGRSSNINEVYFGAAISPIENFNFSTYYYLDAGIENTFANGYVDLSADYTLPWAWGPTFIAHAGHYDRQDGSDDYWDWKFAIAKDIGAFNFEVAYHDTDDGNFGSQLDDGRVVGTVSSSF